MERRLWDDAESAKEKGSDRGDLNQEILITNIQRARLSAEIIDLQAERARREASAEKERQAQAQAQAEREGRRQRLLDLAETLGNDADAQIDLRQIYPAAGYQLEDRGVKRVWVYPHDDLKAERGAAFEARKAWDARKREQKEKHHDRVLDAAAREEPRNGFRAPEFEAGNSARPAWAVYRERVLTEAYGQEVGYWLGRWVRVDLDRSAKTLHIHNKAMDLTDYGDRVVAKEGNDTEITAMLKIADAKGWKALTLTGGADFQMRAGAAALREGFRLTDEGLAARIAAQQAAEVEAQRATAQERAQESQPIVPPLAEPARVSAESPPSSEVKPGIRYLVEETADHAPYRDKAGQVMILTVKRKPSSFAGLSAGNTR
jgi:hypothetical protein